MGGVRSLAVWAGDKPAGILAREGGRDYVFAYSPEAAADQVSLTMPVRLESWLSHELHPIFQTGSRICVAFRPWGTAQKYTGSYERVARSIRDFVSGDCLPAPRSSFSRPWCCR
jgi:hypothetical protein